MSRLRSAFSLIELLVVISIIALLIGILLPTLPKVRDTARKAACGASLRSVGQGIAMYQTQFKDVFPKARYIPRPWISGDTDPSLRDAMANFVEEAENAYKCPGDKLVFSAEYTDGQETKKCGMSYLYLPTLSGQKFEDTFWYKRMRKTPSDTPVSFDFDNGNFEREGDIKVLVPFFHSSRNLLFADGNVGKYVAEADPSKPPDPPPQ
jgi:prepilin-type N-terminal cleavage/methylation domain-containing protein/prepilin-type processing-associated H-X9-DG protein